MRYEAKGCNVELELLSNCIGTTGKYEYSPYSANEHKLARNANELFAQLPLGAARLSGNVKGNRVLRTDYMMAGQYALPAGTDFRATDLRGADCTRATHVVSAVYVGAFAMGAGESRTMEAGATLFGAGAGGKTSADVEVLGDEGDAAACRVSQRDFKESEGCAVPLRIGLIALTRSDSVQNTANAAPAAPDAVAARAALPTAATTPAPTVAPAAPPAASPASPDRSTHTVVGPSALEQRLRAIGQVRFMTDKATIKDDESEQALKSLVAFLTSERSVTKLRVEVHTDNTGSTEHSLDLSRRRAEAIVSWLVAHGIDSARLVAVGWGSQRPIVPNVTEAGRARNRRSEYRVEEIDGQPPTR